MPTFTLGFLLAVEVDADADATWTPEIISKKLSDALSLEGVTSVDVSYIGNVSIDESTEIKH